MPEQRVSDTVRNSADWYKPMYDYLVQKGISLNNRTYTQENLNAANGIVAKKTFQEVLQPFSGDGEPLKDLPGEIRATDFITPIREKNLGEYLELPYKFFVTTQDPDAIMRRTVEVQEQVFGLMQQKFAAMVEQQQQEGRIDVEQIDFQQEATNFTNEFFDDKAIQDQNTLNLINALTDFETQRLQWFFYWWATEEFYTYRYILNDEIIKETISPLNAYPISNGSQFNEDDDAFIWKVKLSFQQFLSAYGNDDELSEDDLEYLRSISVDSRSGLISAPVHFLRTRVGAFDQLQGSFTSDQSRLEFPTRNEDLVLWNIVFKTQVEKKELTYMTPMGQIATMIVPKDYVLMPEAGDIKIKSLWIEKVFLGRRFGDENVGIYFKPKEFEIQRYDEVTNTCKLPIGGKRGIMDGVALNPIPRRLLPYLAVDRILLLRIEREIAKFFPSITQIPQSLINDDAMGTTIEKLRHMKADDKLLVDDTAVDGQVLLQGLRTVAGPQIADYLQTLWDIRRESRAEAWDVANMNSERFGAASSSQTVSNANQNIYRAKLGSTVMISMFNEALRREHMADLEFSKYAYRNGKKGSFYDQREGTFVDVDIDPIQHIKNAYGVFVVNAKAEEEKLQQFKDFSFAAAQNGDNDLAIEAIDADHVPLVKRALRKADAAKKDYEKWVQEQETARVNNKIEADAAAKQLELDTNERIEDKKNATTIESKYVDVAIAKLKLPTTTTEEGSTDINPMDDVIAQSKLRIEQEYLKLDQRAQAHKENMDKRSADQKDRDLTIKARKPLKKVN